MLILKGLSLQICLNIKLIPSSIKLIFGGVC